ncbi:hypothetical protein FGB62_60g02 [Gracilaria domingensis]|nr:hypothetical protein FGB62_60g02 [Gracilaria domingensis]
MSLRRRGCKRDASFLSGDSSVSEAVQSALAFSPDVAAVIATTSPPPKRRRSHLAVRDRTVARALSAPLYREWKTQRFLKQRRAMEKNSGQSLAHYAGLAEAAAAGVAFTEREACCDRARARAVPQPMRSEFVAPGEGGATMKEKERLWGGRGACMALDRTS